MKKLALAICLVSSLMLTACSQVKTETGPAAVDNLPQTETVIEESSEPEELDWETRGHNEDKKEGWFKDAYIFKSDNADEIYRKTDEALSEIYSKGLESEYRTIFFYYPDKNAWNVYIVKSLAASPFDLYVELKDNKAMFDKMVIVANSEESPAQIALDKDVYWQAVIEGPDYDPATKSAKGTNWDIVQSKKTAYDCEDYQKNAVIYDLFTSWERQYKGICDAQWQMIDNDTYNMEPWGFDMWTAQWSPDRSTGDFGQVPVTVYTELYTAGNILMFTEQ